MRESRNYSRTLYKDGVDELGRCGSKQIQSHEKTVLGTWFCQLCKGGDCLPDATFIDAQEST